MPATPSSPHPRSRILGTGRYTPERVLTNADLEAMVDTSDSWIVERTGIRERRIARPDENTSDMAVAAARHALEMAGLTANDLSMIVVGTISGDVPMPACAAYVQHKLGAKNVPAFDISAACAGFLYGLSIADQFIATGQSKYVLVIGVELLSRLLNWSDRATCVIFGDGAGAALLGPAEAAVEGRTARGILATRLFTDGALTEALIIPGGGAREPLTVDALAQHRDKVHMAGPEVFKIAVKNLVGAGKEVLEAAGLSADDVTWVVAHQANARILAQVSARLGIGLDRFIINIARYGNTSSASIPIALDEGVRDGRIKPGDVIAMCALGAGIAWGGAALRF